MTLFPMLLIWFVVLLISLYSLWKGLSTGEIPMKKGIRGTPLEKSRALFWMQMSLLAILALYTISIFFEFFIAST